MPAYSIVLADDHTLFRKGIIKIIEEDADLQVIGEVGDGLDLLDLLKRKSPQMIIVDISMPGLRGIEATSEIKRLYPDIKVLFLSMHKDKEHLYHAVSAGAEGYLLKEDADRELFSAIQTIREGGVYISPILASQVAELVTQMSQKGGRGGRPADDSLTTREREILKLVAEGKSSKDIADRLFISHRTVQHHRANIMRKLDVKTGAELVKYAIRKGYTTTMD